MLPLKSVKMFFFSLCIDSVTALLVDATAVYVQMGQVEWTTQKLKTLYLYSKDFTNEGNTIPRSVCYVKPGKVVETETKSTSFDIEVI